MSRSTCLGLIAAVALIAFSAHAASTNCLEQIKQVEKEKQSAIGMTTKQEDGYNNMIRRARAAAKQGKEKSCLKRVEKARLKLHQ